MGMIWKGKRGEKDSMQNKIHSSFIHLKQSVFSLQFFSMIYQAMKQTVGICDSLLTSQKQSIHVRATKTWWVSTHLLESAPHTPLQPRPCARDALNQKQDRCIQLIPPWVNMPNSSLSVYLLCIYMHIQTTAILKWLSAHTETALEAEKLQPCALRCTDLSPCLSHLILMSGDRRSLLPTWLWQEALQEMCQSRAVGSVTVSEW